jgi:hypothetical protein
MELSPKAIRYMMEALEFRDRTPPTHVSPRQAEA